MLSMLKTKCIHSVTSNPSFGTEYVGEGYVELTIIGQFLNMTEFLRGQLSQIGNLKHSGLIFANNIYSESPPELDF